MKLFVRIEETFGCKLPLAVLFKAPTIEKISAEIEVLRHSSPGSVPRRSPTRGWCILRD